jgi:hypothetical protein
MNPAVTVADVVAFLEGLEGVELGESWGMPTWKVRGHSVCWFRGFSKADLRRFGDKPVPSGDILAVTTATLKDKDELLARHLAGFFTIPHFDHFAAVLVALNQANRSDVDAVLLSSWKHQANRPPQRPRKRRT